METESKDAKNLHEQRKFGYENVTKYHLQFLNKETNEFDEKYTEKRNCPVCNSENHKLLFNKSGGTYVKCKDCTMVFTNPSFTEKSLDYYYTNLNTGQAQVTKNENEFYTEIYTNGLKVISNFNQNGKLLDIGCSSGFFLDVAKKHNWDTTGLEPGKDEAKMCKDKGHSMILERLEDQKLNQKFDVVTMWDVFEHIPYASKYLGLLSEILNENGIVFMQIPNSGSVATRIMKQESKMFDGLEHVNLYNHKTIKMVAESNGFEVVHISSVISEISVTNNYLSYEDPYFGKSEFKEKILGIIDAEEIHKNLMGYKLQIILRKK